MRASGIDAQMMDLGWLLGALEKGQLALPEFQRDFLWTPEDVRELLITVFSGWPAGSLLLLRRGGEFFRLRSFESASGLDDPTLIVLDGQQRLTALHQAFFDRGDIVYAVDTNRIGVSRDLDEAIIGVPRERWSKGYATDVDQARSRIIPCAELVTASQFFEWRDRVVRAAEESEDLKKTLTDVYTGLLAAVHRYEVPAIILEKTVAPAAIARIFERVNRLGTPLNTFDLMVAKIFDPKWNLRDKWEEARRETDWLEWGLRGDGMTLLQTIALLERNDLRQSAVLDLDRKEVRGNWSRTVQGVDSALAFLNEECGVVTPDWLPYKSFVTLFGAIAAETQLDSRMAGLRRFFWNKSFGQAYDAAANTRIVADYNTYLLRGRGNGISYTPFDLENLYYASRQTSRALWAAFLCLLEDSGTGGLFAEFEERTSPTERRVTSVVPRGMSPELPGLPAPHLRILGLIHGSNRTIRAINRNGLVAHALRMADEFGEAEVDGALEKHLLPPLGKLESLERDWKDLFDARLSLVEMALRAREVVWQLPEENDGTAG